MFCKPRAPLPIWHNKHFTDFSTPKRRTHTSILAAQEQGSGENTGAKARRTKFQAKFYQLPGESLMPQLIPVKNLTYICLNYS